MTWEAMGAVAAALVAVFIAGRVWFCLVEGALSGLKRLFGRKEQAAWHPLPLEQEKKENEHV